MQSKKPYEKIIAWQKAHQFTLFVYQVTDEFPDSEKFGLSSQLRRAASSIALNIVEGQARQSKKEFVRFLFIARGSAAECSYILRLTRDLEYISLEVYEKLSEQLDQTSYFVQALLSSLNRS